MSTTQTFKDLYTYFAENDCESITPQIEIEQTILSQLIGGKTQYQGLILAHTCKEMFTDKDLRTIYEIICKFVQNNGVNALTFYELIDSLEGQAVKYVEYIQFLNNQMINSASAQNWIIRLHNRYEKRLLSECKTRKDYETCEKELNKYRLETTECKLLDTAMQYLNEYDNRALSIVKTYYQSIDNLIGGLQGGNYMILAGSTGMGKTVMALNLATSIAKHSKKILFFSLEMTADELLGRLIAQEIGISSENIRNRNLTDDEMNKYVAYIDSEKFKKLQNMITIPKDTNLNIAKIEGIVRSSKADVIFLDYLGLIRGDNNKTNTYEQISDISRRLKLLAIETNKPLIVLHQLNRDMKDRQDKHPKLSDIRDSGKIEQDSDFICFVYRPSYFDLQQDKTKFEFIVAKSRHTGGANKIAQLKFNGQYQRITDPLGETKEDIKQCMMTF